MKKEKVIEIDTKELLALCHILDDFEEFNKRAVIFFDEENKNNLLEKLFKIAVKKERCFNARKAKKFYEENKKVIDTIKEHYGLWEFFMKRYCWQEKYNEELIAMYNYIKENKEDLDKIIINLEKIKDLELNKIHFNKDYDFTNDTYEVKTYIYSNMNFIYLDNLEAIPSYENDKVKYKTNGSNYKIMCSNRKFFLLNFPDDIYLNSLTFDKTRLPNSLNEKEIHNKLLSLSNTKKEEYDAIRNSVDLNIKIEGMTSLACTMEEIIEKLDNIKTKDELKENLSEISKRLSNIQNITDTYDKEIIKNSEFITIEVLEKEKQLEKKKKIFS